MSITLLSTYQYGWVTVTKSSEYFNTRPLTHNQWILLMDKVDFQLACQDGRLKYGEYQYLVTLIFIITSKRLELLVRMDK